MVVELIIVLSVLILGFAVLIFFINHKLTKLAQKDTDKTLVEWLSSMQRSLDTTQKTLNQSLAQNTQSITTALNQSSQALNKRLDNASQVISQVSKEIGQMSEIGRSMQDLQAFLASPKLRDNLGEQVLKELLTQTLPKQQFFLQKSFKSGAIVDAAIQTDAGLICIDSKFPLTSFKKIHQAKTKADQDQSQKEFAKDVKKHIDDIAKKYILTDEGTLDYALMYVPSEAVYYQIMAESPNLAEYANKKRVLPVSPSIFYAFLRAILMSLEGKKLQKRTHEILSSLRSIQVDYKKTQKYFDVLSRHITNAQNAMNSANLQFKRLGDKIALTNELQESSQDQIPEKLEE